MMVGDSSGMLQRAEVPSLSSISLFRNKSASALVLDFRAYCHLVVVSPASYFSISQLT
jgi:hypothetical protein